AIALPPSRLFGVRRLVAALRDQRVCQSGDQSPHSKDVHPVFSADARIELVTGSEVRGKILACIIPASRTRLRPPRASCPSGSGAPRPPGRGGGCGRAPAAGRARASACRRRRPPCPAAVV